MKNFSEQDLFNYFNRSIEEETFEILKNLEKEIETIRKKEIAIINNELEKSKNINLYAKEKLLYQKHQQKLSQLKYEYDLKLMKIRDEFVDKMILKIHEKIKKYVKTQAYIDKMITLINNYENKIKHIEVMEKDALINKVKNIKIVTNEKIIGGIKIILKDEKKEVDATFNLKLEDAKKWFYENSQLFLKEK